MKIFSPPPPLLSVPVPKSNFLSNINPMIWLGIGGISIVCIGAILLILLLRVKGATIVCCCDSDDDNTQHSNSRTESTEDPTKLTESVASSKTLSKNYGNDESTDMDERNPDVIPLTNGKFFIFFLSKKRKTFDRRSRTRIISIQSTSAFSFSFFFVCFLFCFVLFICVCLFYPTTKKKETNFFPPLLPLFNYVINFFVRCGLSWRKIVNNLETCNLIECI